MIIANKLYQYGIPYVYEPAMDINGRILHPDFLVLNPATRKEYIHEHFGLMDDPEYMSNALKKVDSYILAGFLPGDGPITTHETRDNPLNMKTLDILIQSYYM